MAWVQLQDVLLGTTTGIAAAWQSGLSAANQAIAIDRHDGDAYAFKAILLGFATDGQRATEDLVHARRAYELNPTSKRSAGGSDGGSTLTAL